MSSPKYLASVDNSTVYPSASDESPKSARVAEALGLAHDQGPALCWEVWRAFKRHLDGEGLPAWTDLDERTRGRFLVLYWNASDPDQHAVLIQPGRSAADTTHEFMKHALLDGIMQAVAARDYWTEKLGGKG